MQELAIKSSIQKAHLVFLINKELIFDFQKYGPRIVDVFSDLQKKVFFRIESGRLTSGYLHLSVAIEENSNLREIAEIIFEASNRLIMSEMMVLGGNFWSKDYLALFSNGGVGEEFIRGIIENFKESVDGKNTLIIPPKRKCLIVGGAGFIGSHTAVALYESGYVPIIVDDFRNSDKGVIDRITQITGERPTVYEGDCTDVVFMKSIFEKETDISGIIHFAGDKAVGESVVNPLKYYRNNLVSMISILEMMKDYGVHNIIFSSSATVYGEPETCPINENFPLKEATSPYGDTKKICENIIHSAMKSKASPVKAVSLRYFNPIGAHKSGLIGEQPQGIPDNLVPYLIQVASGKRDELTIHGDDYPTKDGTGVRDYIHVSDLAEAHIAALEYLLKKEDDMFYDVFNVGSGEGVTVLGLIRAFEDVSGVKVPYKIGPRRDGDIATCFAAVDKIKNILGWSAKRSIHDALRDAWKWENEMSGKK